MARVEKRPLEKAIENNLKRAVKARGGIAFKFLSGVVGVPDRLVLLPKGRIAFVELKATGETMRPSQIHRKGQLERLGFRVYCIDRAEDVEGVLNEICTT